MTDPDDAAGADDVAAALAAFPPGLRALVEAEVRAGNAVAEVGHGHPAPPRGAFVRMALPLGTSVPDDLDGRERSSSLWSTEVTDADRVHWVLGAPLPPPAEPDMAAIREAVNRPTGEPAAAAMLAGATSTSTAWDRFRASIPLDHERWHDGIGIDLDAIDALDPDERLRAETVLLAGAGLTWREIEALARLGTPGVEPALREVLRSGRLEDRLAVVDHAPELLGPGELDALLVEGLATATALDGRSRLLRRVEQHHPPVVLDALLAAARQREPEMAVHAAALVDHLLGPARSSFDWDHRPFYLRFWAEPGSPERDEAWRELCARAGRLA